MLQLPHKICLLLTRVILPGSDADVAVIFAVEEFATDCDARECRIHYHFSLAISTKLYFNIFLNWF